MNIEIWWLSSLMAESFFMKLKTKTKEWNGDFWKVTEKGKWFSRIYEACVPNARWCNHRNSTETRGNVSIVAFEFNGRIVSCRIARLVRSIRASAINAALPTIENRGRTVGIVLRMDPDRRRSFPRPGKKNAVTRQLFQPRRKSGSTAISLIAYTSSMETDQILEILQQPDLMSFLIEKFNYFYYYD